MTKIDAFFQLMHKQEASDLHLSAGQRPALRINGEIHRVNHPVLADPDLREMLSAITPEDKMKAFDHTGEVDFGFEIAGLARFRANYFLQRNGMGAVFRRIPTRVSTVAELGLPPMVAKLADLPDGLVLVTGPTGSGKSTTLAALIDAANDRRRGHIITIEDPVEFVHHSRKCLVSQREVGLHTRSFETALRGALREDPDILLLGEMRDLETVSMAVEAATTGHLVFSTLHTSSAAKTVDRIIDVFPSHQQSHIRAVLADGLRAVISQVLFKKIDGAGRCAALEIMIATPAIRNLIREGKTHQIPGAIQTGKGHGMQSMADAVTTLVNQNRIDAAAINFH